MPEQLSALMNTAHQHPEYGPYLKLLSIIVGSSLLFFLCRAIVTRVAEWASRGVSILWAKPFLNPRMLSQVSWVLPILVIHLGLTSVTDLPPILNAILQKFALMALVIVILRALTLFLSGVNETYSALDVARNRPIKGFIQVSVILLYAAALILMISILLDRSPWVFLSGLGAMTAILLLIFRDTLLSLVAGFQLTTNDFIRVGDWVEIPQFGADGDVIDIALHAVRVQNWDRTITVIPTHKFLEHAFKNWRGMKEAGGRRIKRSIFIDMNSVRFLSENEIESLSRFTLLQDYLRKKREELSAHNKKFADTPGHIVNSRRLTNLGTFRAYLINYLGSHPHIHQKMTQMVRQMAPGAQGIPLEIYVFTSTTLWTEYEGIQADVFDHILAIMPEFGLRVFQDPTGSDLKEIPSTLLRVRESVDA